MDKGQVTMDNVTGAGCHASVEEVPAGYKRTDVGVIPEEWEVTRIDIHAAIKTGAKNTQDKQDDGKYPFFVRSQEVERINSYSYDGEAVLTAGDGVGTGKIFHYIVGRFDVHQRVYRISDFSDRLNGHFFFYQFSTRFYDRIMSMTAKSSVDSVRMEMIAGMKIPLPHYPEQRAIAGALLDVDELIGALGKLIAKKRAIKLATMQQLLTGKTRLPGFSGEWERRSFGVIFNYYSTATNSRSDLIEDGDTYYVHYGDIHTRFHNHLDFKVAHPPRINRRKCRNASLLKNGDWIMADASEDYDGVGKAIEVMGLEENSAAVAGLHTFLLREKTPTFYSGFKGHLGNLNSLHEQMLRVATGMKVFGVSKTALRDLLLPVPPFPEQRAIAEVLSDMDAEIAALERRCDKTKAIKQGMMQQLLTGRIRLIKEAS